MATEITALTPFGQFFPFTGLSDPRQELTELPRSELTFNELNADITLGGVGDDQLLNITCTLPAGYSYVLLDLNLQIFIAAAANNASMADWEGTAEAHIVESGEVSTANALWYMQGISNGPLLVLEDIQARRIYTFEKLVKKVIVPKTSNAVLTLNVANPIDASPAAKANFQARFLVYDIAQAHHVWVNTATLVR